ncbi:MAG: amino acid permease [Bryobacteraceae bacterium]|jgi:APA family basic amino acid/polyamine antiporter
MPETAPISLRRDMGLWAAMSIVVGTVIGSGIFIVPKTMILQVGSPGMVLLVWVFGGLLTLAGALTYAELAAMMPEAGGEYVYLKEAYGPFCGFVYGWTQMWVAKSASVATLATGFYLYLANFFPALGRVVARIPLPGNSGAPLAVHVGPIVFSFDWLAVEPGSLLVIRAGQLFAMVLIFGLGFINWLGVRQGAGVQVTATLLKVALLAAIIGCGLFLGAAHAENFTTSVPAPGGAVGFFAALVAALWAYDGWNNVGMVSGEIRNPRRNLPWALILGTTLVILIYVAANLAYFAVLPASAVAASDRVPAEMMRRLFGSQGAAAVSLVAMISIFAALNGSILSGSRVPYALARDGYFFRAFASVSPRRHVPGFSILALSAWSAVLVLSGRYDQLFTLVIFPSWILYGMATASVLVLRRKRPDIPRPYRTVGYPVVPVVFVLVAALFLGFTLKNSPRESILGMILIAAGVPFYRNWKRRLRESTRV